MTSADDAAPADMAISAAPAAGVATGMICPIAVGIAAKDDGPAVAAASDMVEGIGKIKTQWAWHAERIAARSRDCKRSGIMPPGPIFPLASYALLKINVAN